MNGVLRDSAQLAPLDIVVKALGLSPRRPGRKDDDRRDIVLGFGNAVLNLGKPLVSDETEWPCSPDVVFAHSA